MAACTLAPACGKKGSPLPPIVHIPEAPPTIAAQRIGDDVYVTTTVPSQNIDESMPADVSRIEVYGVTANTPVPTARFLEVAQPVGEVPVLPPPAPDAPPRPVATARLGGAVQGAPVTLRDSLTAAELVPRALPIAEGRRASDAFPAPPPGPLERSYVAIAFGPNGRPGPPARVDLPITLLPAPPPAVEVGYSRSGVLVSWEPSGGLLGFLTDRALPMEADPTAGVPASSAPSMASVPRPRTGAVPSRADRGPALPLPPGPTSYLVYRTLSPDPLVLAREPAPAWRALPPDPLNATPTSMLSFTDRIEGGREQCYVVRSVRGAAPSPVIGRPSPRRCVRPIDIFPPAAPTGLAAIVAEGAVSLIWEPNVEDDLSGYVILRGDAGDATLQSLTPVPVTSAQFTDRTVTPGRRYVYAVVAVDNRVPLPNVSDESNRVEETAR